MRHFSHSTSTEYTIEDYATFRKGTAAPASYNKDILNIIDDSLPAELVTDLVLKGKNSIYAPYIVNVDLDKLHPLPPPKSELDQKEKDDHQPQIMTLLIAFIAGVIVTVLTYRHLDRRGDNTGMNLVK